MDEIKKESKIKRASMTDTLDKTYKTGLNTVHFTYLVLCFFPVFIAFFLNTDGYYTALKLPLPIKTIIMPCLFKLTTGYNCPSCGLTRSFIYMSQFDLANAVKLNIAGVP